MGNSKAIEETDTDGKVLVIEKKYSGIPFGRSMREAIIKHRKNIFSQIKDFSILTFGRGRLSPKEYYDYLLFDDNKFSWAEKKRFVGLRGNESIAVTCNKETGLFGLMSDKLAVYGLLKGLGFPIPTTLALVHRSRTVPFIKCLNSIEMVRQYLEVADQYPIFTKPNSSSMSLGAASLKGYDKDKSEILCLNGERYDVDLYLKDVNHYLDDGYLIQKLLVRHPITQRYAGDNISTVRMLTIRKENGPQLLHAAWKIPSSKNIADNFWRSGNILGHVDIGSGRIVRVVQGLGIDQKLIGPELICEHAKRDLVIPNWPQTVDMVLSAMDAFPGLNIVGWDIAICQDGPVIVEANDIPDLRLHQIAEGRGILDDEMAEFVAYCRVGWKERRKAQGKRLRKFYQNEIQMTAQQSTPNYR